MINTEINEFANQSNLTQVASYFDIIDTAVKTGDTNKRYTISTNACNAPSAPIKNGGWTSLVISPVGDNMCDLYNSYITGQINFKLSQLLTPVDHSSSGDLTGTDPALYWVGFKDAMDIVEQYQLVANGQAFYTQSNAIEESYVTGLGSTEAVKSVDCWSKTRHKDVWKGKGTTCLGKYVKESMIKNKETISFNFKIDLRRFLPLASIKMIPAFVGNLEIRIKFGASGMVCTPLPLENIVDFDISKIASYSSADITNHFVPILENFKQITKITTAGASTDWNRLECTNVDFTNIYSHLHCFGLDDNLYNQLVQRYQNEALSFPVQTLVFQCMNGQPSGKKLDLVLTSTPRFVDSIFILIQKNQDHRTCYINPLFESFTFKMGGYGTIPDVQYNTYSPAFYEMCSNAYNTNNDMTGFNKDVMTSIVNPLNTDVDYINDKGESKENSNGLGHRSKDTSNFIIAFPTSTDFTYQQGQTSNTPITYQLKCTLEEESPLINRTGTIPMIGFLTDSVLAIQLRPVGPPIVSLDSYDITSPASN